MGKFKKFLNEAREAITDEQIEKVVSELGIDQLMFFAGSGELNDYEGDDYEFAEKALKALKRKGGLKYKDSDRPGQLGEYYDSLPEDHVVFDKDKQMWQMQSQDYDLEIIVWSKYKPDAPEWMIQENDNRSAGKPSSDKGWELDYSGYTAYSYDPKTDTTKMIDVSEGGHDYGIEAKTSKGNQVGNYEAKWKHVGGHVVEDPYDENAEWIEDMINDFENGSFNSVWNQIGG